MTWIERAGWLVVAVLGLLSLAAILSVVLDVLPGGEPEDRSEE